MLFYWLIFLVQWYDFFVCVYTVLSIKTRGQSPSWMSSPNFLIQGLSWNLKLPVWPHCWLPSPRDPSVHICPAHFHTTAISLYGAEEPNSGPHACMTRLSYFPNLSDLICVCLCVDVHTPCVHQYRDQRWIIKHLPSSISTLFFF